MVALQHSCEDAIWWRSANSQCSHWQYCDCQACVTVKLDTNLLTNKGIAAIANSPSISLHTLKIGFILSNCSIAAMCKTTLTTLNLSYTSTTVENLIQIVSQCPDIDNLSLSYLYTPDLCLLTIASTFPLFSSSRCHCHLFSDIGMLAVADSCHHHSVLNITNSSENITEAPILCLHSAVLFCVSSQFRMYQALPMQCCLLWHRIVHCWPNSIWRTAL